MSTVTKSRRSRSNLPVGDPRALPIAVKLAIGLAILLLIAGFIADIVIQQVVRTSQEEIIRQELETLSQTQASRLRDLLDREIESLSRLGESELIQDQVKLRVTLDAGTAPEDLETIAPDGLLTTQVVAFHQEHPELSSVALVDGLGRVLAIDPIVMDSDAIVPEEWVWFQEAFNGGQGGLHTANPHPDFLTGQYGVHIAVPIYDPDLPDQAIGVIYAVWSMNNAFDVAGSGSNRETLILEPGGTIIASPTDEPGAAMPAAVLRLLGALPAGNFVFRDSQNREWLYGYMRLNNLNIEEPHIRDLNWTLLIRQPAASILPSVRLLARNIRAALAITAVAITVALAAFSVVLLRPLGQLTDAASRLEHGDLTTEIPRLPADEVGRLANVFRSLVARLFERLSELRSAVQVSHAALLTLDQTQMLGDIARALTAQFGYPDARVYLTDATGKRAVIQAAAGAEGERLLRIGHRLGVDESSLVGRAILLGEPQVGAERVHLQAAGLMAGRSELAIPLHTGGHALGAIHILARRMGEFEAEEVDILRLIADQLSASIQNARLFQESAANLSEIEALNRRLTRQAWEEYVVGGTVRHTLDPEENWPDPLAVLGQRSEVQAETYVDENGRSVLAVPLVLRGQAVGTIAVTRPVGEHWSRDEAALMESIAARMAVIAEGIRLVDESNRRALREQRVNEVSATLLQRATDVESVLRTALNELGGALGTERISLRLGPAPEMDRQLGLTGDGYPLDETADSNGDEQSTERGSNGGMNNV